MISGVRMLFIVSGFEFLVKTHEFIQPHDTGPSVANTRSVPWRPPFLVDTDLELEAFPQPQRHPHGPSLLPLPIRSVSPPDPPRRTPHRPRWPQSEATEDNMVVLALPPRAEVMATSLN
jgi:hypothetical protein